MDKIVCIVGPTGCGKTRLGVLLAKRFHGEVVSADSMQIYRGMEIGSAAPASEEQDGIPHHMIGVADPNEHWSAARYVKTVLPVIDGILRRGNLPILVGGTGLWMEAAVRGEQFAPGNGGAVRKELEARLAAEGIGPLWDELCRTDPATAARVHPADSKRVIRALEVWKESGQTLSGHDAQSARRPPRYDAVWLGVRYKDRAVQCARLNERVDAMARAGLLEEVRRLAARVPPDATALQGIGYKELLPALNGQKSLSACLEEVKLRTRQYAKRQLTWFRRNPAIHWMEWDESQNFPLALQISTEILTDAGVCY